MSEETGNTTEAGQNLPANVADNDGAGTAAEAGNQLPAKAADPVLSEAEVDALLTGVEQGLIEVHTAGGPRRANVTEFEIPRRSRITTGSLPRLDLLHAKLAERLQQLTQVMVGIDLSLVLIETRRCHFGQLAESDDDGLIVANEFTAEPLHGAGAVVLDHDLVAILVELLFGGVANEFRPDQHEDFTPGVMRVVDSYVKVVLEAMQASWAATQAIQPVRQRAETSIGLLTIAEDTDPVIRTEFEVTIGEHSGKLWLLLPDAMIAAHLPAFEGAGKVLTPTDHERWAGAIRSGLPDVTVGLATTVGKATMTLGELICLQPGDIIGIDNPTEATILANDIKLMRGRFGVHLGHNAVAASHWLRGQPVANDPQAART